MAIPMRVKVLNPAITSVKISGIDYPVGVDGEIDVPEHTANIMLQAAEWERRVGKRPSYRKVDTASEEFSKSAPSVPFSQTE